MGSPEASFSTGPSEHDLDDLSWATFCLCTLEPGVYRERSAPPTS